MKSPRCAVGYDLKSHESVDARGLQASWPGPASGKPFEIETVRTTARERLCMNAVTRAQSGLATGMLVPSHEDTSLVNHLAIDSELDRPDSFPAT